jgi:hypothetical protein
LVKTLEDFAFQHGDFLKYNPSTSALVIFEYQNIHLQVKYIKQGNTASIEERLFRFPSTSFILSPDALSPETIVAVVWYKTLHSFIRNSFHGSKIFEEVKREVVTASVRPKPPETFEEPVRISWNLTGMVSQNYNSFF